MINHILYFSGMFNHILYFDVLTGQNMPEIITCRKSHIAPALDRLKTYLTSTRSPHVDVYCALCNDAGFCSTSNMTYTSILVKLGQKYG